MERRTRLIGVVFDQPIRDIHCIGAHADDIEIGAAGLVARLADRHPDAKFRFVVLSGDDDRRLEAEESMVDLVGGRGDLIMKLSTDNLIPYEDPTAVKAFLRSAAATSTPQIVIAPRREDRHQDHSFVASLVDQIYRDHLVLSYEIPKYDGDLGRPRVFVPLTNTEMEAKVEHLLGHFGSQQDKAWYSPDLFRSLMRIRGVECNSPSGFAEAFYISKMRLA